jgi:hypothetical protein
MNNPFLRRLTVILAAALLGGACIAQADMSDSTPRIVYVTPTGETPRSDSPPSEETPASETTPTPTAISVTMTAGQSLSCVTGPDWKLYEWVAGIPAGEAVTLIARAVPEIPDYYVARTGGGQECWVFGGSSVISGPVAMLPVRETPPPPTVSFVVQNEVYISLVDVFIRPAGEAAWGDDRLTVAGIYVGMEAAISLTAGYYDVRILDIHGTAMYEAYNRAIGVEDAYRILEVATDVEFTIRNGYAFNICKVAVIFMMSGSQWKTLYDAADGGGPIHTGEERQVTMRAGQFSMRVTDCSDTGLPPVSIYIYPGIGVVLI